MRAPIVPLEWAINGSVGMAFCAQMNRGAFNLLVDLRSLSERWILRRRLAHFGVSVRIAKAVKIQTPNVEACIAEFIAPGASIKAMCNRQRGWK